MELARGTANVTYCWDMSPFAASSVSIYCLWLFGGKSTRLAANGDMSRLWRQPCDTACPYDSTPFRSNNLDEILFTEELQTACYHCYCDTVIRTRRFHSVTIAIIAHCLWLFGGKSTRLAANGDMSRLWRQPCDTACPYCSTPFRSNNLDEILFTEELQTACYHCYCDTVIRIASKGG
jgi:muconolactone delta-isomerase